MIRRRIALDLLRIEQDVSALRTSMEQIPASSLIVFAQIYTGLEKTWERSLRFLEVELPTAASDYHKELLLAANYSGLVPEQHLDSIRELLLFRHFARHNYGATLRGFEVAEKVESCLKWWPQVRDHLQAKLDLPAPPTIDKPDAES